MDPDGFGCAIQGILMHLPVLRQFLGTGIRN